MFGCRKLLLDFDRPIATDITYVRSLAALKPNGYVPTPIFVAAAFEEESVKRNQQLCDYQLHNCTDNSK